MAPLNTCPQSWRSHFLGNTFIHVLTSGTPSHGSEIVLMVRSTWTTCMSSVTTDHSHSVNKHDTSAHRFPWTALPSLCHQHLTTWRGSSELGQRWLWRVSLASTQSVPLLLHASGCVLRAGVRLALLCKKFLATHLGIATLGNGNVQLARVRSKRACLSSSCWSPQ